ncbi:MAG: flagellar export protein FliJ [Deltaproteobacteria bacterium]|nr:flagellar export protein FliJ [Deltaproteobacteria bacterium]
MFIYSLQSVLEYRQSIEKEKLTEFSDAERNLHDEKRRLQEIGEHRAELAGDLRALQDKACNSRDIVLILKYSEELQRREQRQMEIVREAALVFEERRKDLLEAVKKRKMMETHKEHRHQEYKTDLIAAERRETDDMSIQRFSRRGS